MRVAEKWSGKILLTGVCMLITSMGIACIIYTIIVTASLQFNYVCMRL